MLTSRPLRGCGVLGVANVFYGGVKTQRKEKVHSHASIYLSEIPDICDELEKNCRST